MSFHTLYVVIMAGVLVGICGSVLKCLLEMPVPDETVEAVSAWVGRNRYALLGWTGVTLNAIVAQVVWGALLPVLLGSVFVIGTLRSWIRLGMMLHARRDRRELRGELWWRQVSGTRAIGYNQDGVIVAIDDAWPAAWLL